MHPKPGPTRPAGVSVATPEPVDHHDGVSSGDAFRAQLLDPAWVNDASAEDLRKSVLALCWRPSDELMTAISQPEVAETINAAALAVKSELESKLSTIGSEMRIEQQRCFDLPDGKKRWFNYEAERSKERSSLVHRKTIADRVIAATKRTLKKETETWAAREALYRGTILELGRAVSKAGHPDLARLLTDLRVPHGDTTTAVADIIALDRR